MLLLIDIGVVLKHTFTLKTIAFLKVNWSK